jgi:hypothetical protein
VHWTKRNIIVTLFHIDAAAAAEKIDTAAARRRSKIVGRRRRSFTRRLSGLLRTG